MTTSKNLIPRGHFSHMATGNEVEKVKTRFTCTMCAQPSVTRTENHARTFLIFEALISEKVTHSQIFSEKNNTT